MPVLLACAWLWPAPSLAQITLDGSLGPAGPVTGPNYQITPGMGQIRGPNLFHSFGRFNVGTGETAAFSGPPTIANILARVTGGERSTIDGRLRSEISGANLFLLNPSGVLFGPNASLDVSGAFHVSTADALRLADGGVFHANLNVPSVLTVAPPAAFGFLSANPAGISIQGSSLAVAPGSTISLVGGDIHIAGGGGAPPPVFALGGTLVAPGGRVNIVSVGAAGDATISNVTGEIAVDSFPRLGRIELSQNAIINTGGAAGGTVAVRGDQLLLDSSFMFSDTLGGLNAAPVGIDVKTTGTVALTTGARVTTDVAAGGRGGNIRIEAGRIDLRDQAFIGSRALGGADAGQVTLSAPDITLVDGGISTFATGGRAGDIQVNAGRLTLTGFPIDSSTAGAGAGGTLTVTATESVTVSGRSSTGLQSGLFSFTGGAATGNAGRIILTAPTVHMDEGQITATSLGAGRAGDIELNVGRLTLVGGARVDSNAFGTGPAGTIVVNASDSVAISGRGPQGLPSAINSATIGPGDAGQIMVSAPAVSLDDGGQISTSTQGAGRAGGVDVKVGSLTLAGGASISSNSEFAAGAGGTITVRASDSVTISGVGSDGFSSRLTSGASGTGDAGRITVSAPTLTIDGGSISANTARSGRAGDIEVNVGRLSVTGGGTVVSSTAGSGSGGTVTITATESVVLSGTDQEGFVSGLFSSNVDPFGPATGNAGRITVSTPSLTLADGGAIRTETRSLGTGGDIDLRAAQISLSGNAEISATSTGQGNAGNIRIAGDSFTSRDSFVTTEALSSDGGNITFQIGSLVHLLDSQVTTSVGTGQGRGGNITIDPQAVVLNGSQVRADAFGGPGGNVLIVADVFLTSGSIISASSALGLPGTVTIQTAVSPAETQVAPLPQEFGAVTALLAEHCAVRASERRFSTFVLGGRDGIPAEPGGLLPSPLDLSLIPGAGAEDPTPSVPSRTELRLAPFGSGFATTPYVRCSK